MDAYHRIYIQSARPENLSRTQQRFLKALITRLEDEDLQLIISDRPNATIKDRLETVRQSDGVIVLAFSQWEGRRTTRDSKKEILPTEFAHIGVVMAVATCRPLLILRDRSVAERGVLRSGIVNPPSVSIPSTLDTEWLDSTKFTSTLKAWLSDVKRRRTVFLGYSSQATNVANRIYKYINETLNVRVLDWQFFEPGDTIWQSIEKAERLTHVGIYLFMSDDTLTVSDQSSASGEARSRHIPRDNVVYEAGYFAGKKGRHRTLIILEKGAKLPTDLNGIHYAEIDDRENIAAIETPLRQFIEAILSSQEHDDGR
jgi:hypothetical protein